ncbi:MAG: hypothetical protein GY869_31770, partial [Planctomycetes bacterium]|nr:hypothetical protein [Planctomycetota bacterium]
MSTKLIVLDTQVDPLWRNALPGLSPDAEPAKIAPYEIIDLKTNGSKNSHPHHNDPASWCRWLDKHRINKLHLFLPGKRSHMLRTFACSAVEINLHITGLLDLLTLKSLNLTQNSIAQFFCPALFIARQLTQAGIDSSKITLEIPAISATPTAPERRRQIRRQLQNEKSGPVLLALNAPQNTNAIKSLVWAVALVGRLVPQITLVITGACSGVEKKRIINWQHIMDLDHTVKIEPGNLLWNELTDACDAVIAGPTPTTEIIRLLSAR